MDGSSIPSSSPHIIHHARPLLEVPPSRSLPAAALVRRLSRAGISAASNALSFFPLAPSPSLASRLPHTTHSTQHTTHNTLPQRRQRPPGQRRIFSSQSYFFRSVSPDYSLTTTIRSSLPLPSSPRHSRALDARPYDSSLTLPNLVLEHGCDFARRHPSLVSTPSFHPVALVRASILAAIVIRPIPP
ncbi:hypothetical protein CDD80_4984 [Ophiocordyceps camponoti-rufipedis]|uniref:Uncharacterized protein n=1 Tax=Ophiocordyceps camponoti-rufipedis TaxID=2004952 RepID=A0A2C5YVZ7_9HYPO|nr:hypothetical protein CDD80_4984 [Ophiocordyceps camponoti-rufipedis]